MPGRVSEGADPLDRAAPPGTGTADDADDLDDDVVEYSLTPNPDERGLRLDRFLSDRLPDLSRAYIQRLIDQGMVTVDGHRRKQTFKMTPGETIVVQVPPAEETALEPEPIPLSVLYEDDDVLVIDKPAGLVVHPAPGHPTGTLVNALLHHVPGLSVGGTNRPGIVHRLDKDTSGVMVIAKSDRGHAALRWQWSEQLVGKSYVALVRGVLEPNEGTIDAPIGRDPKDRQRMAVIQGGKEAVTHFTVQRRFHETTLVDVDLETGRTHQIRVHFAFIDHPVVGDKIYNPYSGPAGGKSPLIDRQFLHASRLEFSLPDGADVAFESPLPDDLVRVLDTLAREDGER